LEKLQRLSDPDLSDCPDCGEAALNRLVSAAGFRLKGSGWYETDFKKDGKKNLHDAKESSSKPEPAPTSEPAKTAEPKKTGSKPASTPSDAA
jgi:putative FmdB family regulatory protein